MLLAVCATIARAEDNADDSEEDMKPGKRQRAKSGPNKADIRAAVAAMGFQVRHRKALLLRAAEFFQERGVPSNASHIVNQLKVRMDARHCGVSTTCLQRCSFVKELPAGLLCRYRWWAPISGAVAVNRNCGACGTSSRSCSLTTWRRWTCQPRTLAAL